MKISENFVKKKLLSFQQQNLIIWIDLKDATIQMINQKAFYNKILNPASTIQANMHEEGIVIFSKRWFLATFRQLICDCLIWYFNHQITALF